MLDIFTPQIIKILFQATLESLYMVISSGLLSTFFGVPLGAILYLTKKDQIKENIFVNFLLGININILRAIPTLLIIVLLVTFGITKAIVGTWIGSTAMIVPLTIAATPLMARLAEGVFLSVPYGLIEAARAMGATYFQIFTKFLLAESLPGLINAVTIIMVGLVDASAIAGVVNGGGLGFLGVTYGLHNYNQTLLITAVTILILIVFLLQFIGDRLVRFFTH